ncbi:MAG: hypothetical protein EOP45_09505 [Sphingobacteriaceae bacterium]|nr:MAG: hypothetical protein EOP45_09505 [Sphingobacteriaceae bacterium]
MKRLTLKTILLTVAVNYAASLITYATPAHSFIQTNQDTMKRSKMKKGKKIKMKRDTVGIRAKQDSVR